MSRWKVERFLPSRISERGLACVLLDNINIRQTTTTCVFRDGKPDYKSTVGPSQPEELTVAEEFALRDITRREGGFLETCSCCIEFYPSKFYYSLLTNSTGTCKPHTTCCMMTYVKIALKHQSSYNHRS